MPLHLTPELEQRLAQLAEQTGRSPGELANEALDSYLTHVESLIADVRDGDESAEREGWLAHEEVVKRFAERRTHPDQKLLAAIEEGRAAAQRGELVDHDVVMAMIDDIIAHG